MKYKQWLAEKRKQPGMLMLFRIGDFYEAFHHDAETLNKVCKITLTRRCDDSGETPMAGFPTMQAEIHLKTLLKKGIRAAVMDQTK